MNDETKSRLLEWAGVYFTSGEGFCKEPPLQVWTRLARNLGHAPSIEEAVAFRDAWLAQHKAWQALGDWRREGQQMSAEYSAVVFYGTWAARDSDIGERLDVFVEMRGGTPAPTETDGVEVDIVGSLVDGAEFLTVQVKGSTACYGKGHLLTGPVLLSDAVRESRWKDALTLFFAAEGIDPGTLPPVGWHFAGSVS